MPKTIKLVLMLGIAAMLLNACGTNTNLTPPDDDDILLFGSDATLEVVTWNLRTFPLSEGSLQTVAQVIREMEADVIAFQEIMDYQAFYDLADLVPHYEALVYDATSSYRLAYLYDSRVVQVVDSYTIFTADTNPFPRAPYILEFIFQGSNYAVINNHLKAYGDNFIDESDPWDEEYRRRLACQMLEQYISENLADDKVIVVGDFNDQIAEPEEYNVFQSFLDKPAEYAFADMGIALNPTYQTVSYPSYLSHIDHVLITNELFSSLEQAGSQCRVINVEEYLGSWQNYADQVSDHRPLGLKLVVN